MIDPVYRWKFLKDFLPGFAVILLSGLIILTVASEIQTSRISERTQQLLQRAIDMDSVRVLSRARWERIEIKVDAILLNQAHGEIRGIQNKSALDTVKAVLLKNKSLK